MSLAFIHSIHFITTKIVVLVSKVVAQWGNRDSTENILFVPTYEVIDWKDQMVSERMARRDRMSRVSTEKSTPLPSSQRQTGADSKYLRELIPACSANKLHPPQEEFRKDEQLESIFLQRGPCPCFMPVTSQKLIHTFTQSFLLLLFHSFIFS